MNNKYEKAIKAIKENYPPSNYTMLREGLYLAIIALKKQIAYKPNDMGITYTGEKIGTCKCGNDEAFEHEKYCSNCGQKLNWTDKE